MLVRQCDPLRQYVEAEAYPLRMRLKRTSQAATDAAGHTGVNVMSAAKQEVEALLDKLPDDCTLEDVQYHIYVLEKVQRGVQSADRDGTVSQAEAQARLAKWRMKWSGRRRR